MSSCVVREYVVRVRERECVGKERVVRKGKWSETGKRGRVNIERREWRGKRECEREKGVRKRAVGERAVGEREW